MASSERQPRPVEIFDVTIRDGSYAIDFQFTQEDIRVLCAALERIGFRYIEIGHGFGLNASAVKGASAATDDEYLTAAVESLRQARFGAFFIPGIGTKENLLRARRDFGMHFIRIGDDPEKIEKTAPEYIEYARSLGYEVMANFMKSYALPPRELAKKAKILEACGSEVVYIVDSAGGMLPDEVAEYVEALAGECGARIGFHGHNNLELASANALAAYHKGCHFLDCSIGGLGRSAGNTRTEMMVPVLQRVGAPVDIDFLEMLHVLETVIRPLLRVREITPCHLLSGFARIHSGLMGRFTEAAQKQHIGIEELLLAYGTSLAQDVTPDLDDLAARIAQKGQERRPAVRTADSTLLRVERKHADQDVIQNTFGAVDDVVRAVSVLAQKANLPIAVLISINSAPVDEPYLMADYLYHDEHFVVMRMLCSSFGQFLEIMSKHRDRFAVLAFDEAGADVREALRTRQQEWHRGEKVIYSSRDLRNYHALFATLYQVAMETSARRVLFFGGQPLDLVQHVPPEMGFLEFSCASRDFGSGDHTGFPRIDGKTARPAPQSDEPFEVAVILSSIDRIGIDTVLEHLAEDGTIIDCVHHAASNGLLPGLGKRRVVPLDLYRTFTAEIVRLLEGTRRQALAAESKPPVVRLVVPEKERKTLPDAVRARTILIHEPAYRRGAQALVEKCAGVRPGERVCILADDSTQEVANYLCEAAGRKTSQVRYECIKELGMHGNEPPAGVAMRMSESDVIFCLTRMSLAHTRARQHATNSGARFLSLPDYTLDVLASPALETDFRELVPLARKLSSFLDSGRDARVQTALGTDLSFVIAGRKANCCPGICLEPGTLGSPPDAEVNVAPVEGTAQGIVWVDGSIPCKQLGLLQDGIRLEIRNGRIVDFAGPEREVGELRKLFAAVRAAEAYNLAEFGIGLNPRAKICGRMLEDEGCAGTIHFGFGSNATIGGKSSVPFHLDFVLKSPAVRIDGVELMDKGILREPLLAA